MGNWVSSIQKKADIFVQILKEYFDKIYSTTFTYFYLFCVIGFCRLSRLNIDFGSFDSNPYLDPDENIWAYRLMKLGYNNFGVGIGDSWHEFL